MYLKTATGSLFRVGLIALGRTGMASIDLIVDGPPLEVFPQVLPAELLVDGLTAEEVEAWLVSEDGPYPGGVYIEDEDYILEVAKASARAQAKAKRDAAEVAGVMTPFGLVDSDEKSQRKITGATVMAMILGEQFGVVWRMADNSLAPLTAAQMIELGVAVGVTVARYQMIKNWFDVQIDAATTTEMLDDLDIGRDWSLIDPAAL